MFEKNSKIDFIFLPAFYLIMWLMAPTNSFEKIAILKKWQLVFYWGVKNYFGAMPLKLCIFRHEIFYLCQYFPSNNYCSHQMESVLYLDNILIILGDHNTSKRQLLLSWINISMTNQAYFSPKWILTPQKETSCHIFKMAYFSKFFWAFMNHIIR